jgi:hypothetical protein
MTADEAIAVQRDVTDVYRAAFGAPPYNEGEAQVRQFCDDMLPRHTQRDGFRFVVALESGRYSAVMRFVCSGRRPLCLQLRGEIPA